jgi:hypothetical protein
MKTIFAAAVALALTVPPIAPVLAQDVGVHVGPNGAGVSVDSHRRRGVEFRERDRGRGGPRVVIERRGRPHCRMVEIRTHRHGRTIIRRERRCD